MKKTSVVGILVAMVLGTVAAGLPGQEKAPAKKKDAQPDQAAVQRSRDTVKMLDNIYKQTIVLITEKYVLDEDDYAAGSAAVELFSRIEKDGSHKVRLIDATGEPYDPDNVARNDFEKKALKEIKAGKASYDQVVTKDGKAYLKAMTAVPVVMERCIMCHAHYADAKKGQAIGAISYEVPIK